MQAVNVPRTNSLARVDEVHGEHAEGGDAGEEEIISAAQLDEVRQIGADKGRIGHGSIPLDDVFASPAVIAQKHVFVVALVRVVAVLNPLLLYELELPRDAGVEGHEDDAAIFCV